MKTYKYFISRIRGKKNNNTDPQASYAFFDFRRFLSTVCLTSPVYLYLKSTLIRMDKTSWTCSIFYQV